MRSAQKSKQLDSTRKSSTRNHSQIMYDENSGKKNSNSNEIQRKYSPFERRRETDNPSMHARKMSAYEKTEKSITHRDNNPS